jgi:putative alpha-1,2-mannosidase
MESLHDLRSMQLYKDCVQIAAVSSPLFANLSIALPQETWIQILSIESAANPILLLKLL